MDLYKLMYRCVNLPYLKSGKSGNYAIKKRKDALYLFFEGSNSQTDWKNNFDFPARAYKRMGKTIWRCHRGFLNAWKEIEPSIKNEILNPLNKKIVISGDSHGGGIAMLCHEYVWYHRHDLRDSLEGYGFGAPRVFWGKLPNKLERRWENFTVIRNKEDIITHLPPVLLGYRHVGKILEIGEKENYSKIQAHLPDNILKELLIYQNRLTYR